MRNKAGELVASAIESGISVSGAEVEKFIRAARRRRSSMSDEDLIVALERSYTGLVATSGAVAGGVAAHPPLVFPAESPQPWPM